MTGLNFADDGPVREAVRDLLCLLTVDRLKQLLDLYFADLEIHLPVKPESRQDYAYGVGMVLLAHRRLALQALFNALLEALPERREEIGHRTLPLSMLGALTLCKQPQIVIQALHIALPDCPFGDFTSRIFTIAHESDSLSRLGLIARRVATEIDSKNGDAIPLRTWLAERKLAPHATRQDHRVLSLRLVPHEGGRLELIYARLYHQNSDGPALILKPRKNPDEPDKQFVFFPNELDKLARRVGRHATVVQNKKYVFSTEQLVIRFEVAEQHALIGFHRGTTEEHGLIGVAYRAVTIWPYKWDEDEDEEYARGGTSGCALASRPEGMGLQAIATYVGPCSPKAADLRHCRAARPVFVSGTSGWKDPHPHTQSSIPLALKTHLNCILTVLLDCDDVAPFINEISEGSLGETDSVSGIFAVARQRIAVGQDVHLIWTDTDYWHEDSFTSLEACT